MKGSGGLPMGADKAILQETAELGGGADNKKVPGKPGKKNLW